MPRQLITRNNLTFVNEEWRGMTLEYFPNGQIKHGLLDNPNRIQNFPMCCEVAFYPSGKLKCGRLNEHITIKGVEYFNYIYLYEDGSLMSSSLYNDMVIDGICYAAYQYVDFDSQGNVVAGCLGKEMEIDGKEIPKHSFIKIIGGKARKVELGTKDFYEEKSNNKGASVNNYEVTSWINDRFGGAGAGCSFRDFLQGTINEVIKNDFPEKFGEIFSLAEEKHEKISSIKPEIRLIL